MAPLRALLCALALAGVGCGDDSGGVEQVTAVPGVAQKLRLDASAGFYDAPFPIAWRARADGSLDLSAFPNDFGNATIDQLVRLLEASRAGFSQHAGIFLPFDGALGETRLPATPADSLRADASVFLVDVDPDSPERGRRIPIEVTIKAEPETYSPGNLLVALPFQGAVLRPNTRHALVVRRDFGDPSGAPLGSPLELEQLKRGTTPSGEHAVAVREASAPLFAWLAEAGIDADDVAAFTAFTTGDPTAELLRLRDELATRALRPFSNVRFSEDYPEYCVVAAELELPVFQTGTKPYGGFGSGVLGVDASGKLVEAGIDRVGVLLTVPKRPMPENGFPVLYYAAGAEGTARQVLDRTATARNPDAGLGPRGEGPARYLAHRGIGAVGLPTVHAWERNATGDSGGLTDFWNTSNLGAFRDNLRQGMLDYTTVAAAVRALRLPRSICPAAITSRPEIFFDPGEQYFYGHSTGSSLGSGVVVLEPDVRVGMVSGAGGSWIYNLVDADAPFPLRNVVRFLIAANQDDVIDRFDMPISLFQTVMDPVEAMSWGRLTTLAPPPGRSAKHLLLLGGVIDTYHYPRMINAYAMSLGADVVRPEAEPTAAADLALVGRGAVDAPVRDNLDTASGKRSVVYQSRAQFGDTNGHYVPFEWDDMKYRYSCFFASALGGAAPRLPPSSDDPFAACE